MPFVKGVEILLNSALKSLGLVAVSGLTTDDSKVVERIKLIDGSTIELFWGLFVGMRKLRLK